jgi:hypothetical protein
MPSERHKALFRMAYSFLGNTWKLEK